MVERHGQETALSEGARKIAMQKGRIYQHGGWWMFRYKTPVMRGSKKVWKDRYEKLAPIEQYASAAAIERDGLVAKFRDNLDASKMTPNTMQAVTDFVEHVYFPTKKTDGSLKASTLVGYDNLYVHHIKPRVRGQRMCDFTPRVAQQFIDGIARERASEGRPLSSSTLRHLKWFGVGVFDHAKHAGAFPDQYENPFIRVKVPKTKASSQPTRYATLDEVLDMIDALPDPAATVVAVAAFAGLRKSEIQGLKWEDLRDGELHIERAAWRTTIIEETKSAASNAPVPVLQILAEHLESHRNGSPKNGFVFKGPKMGRPLDLHNLANRTIRPALEKAKIPWCGWHGFRRGLSTKLKTLGVDDTVIQRILRHADVGVTRQSYIKIEDTVKSAAMNKLEAALRRKLKARKKRRKARFLGTNVGTTRQAARRTNRSKTR
jgi:integrase